MRKQNLKFCIVLLVVLYFVVCFSVNKSEAWWLWPWSDKGATEKTDQQTLENITIAQFTHFFVYLPLYIAKQKGFFNMQGLNVTYVSTGGDEKTWAAVTSGNAQFGVADPTFVAIAREKGDNSGKIIAGVIDGVPFWGVSKKEHDIENNMDLNGLRVATFPAPSTNYALMKRMVKSENLNTRIVPGEAGTLFPMLENNRADVVMILEPTVSLASAQGYNVVFSYRDIYDDFAFTGLSTTNEYIKSHPKTCQKVVNALQLAYRYAYENFEGAVDVAKKEFPDIDEAVLRKGVWRMLKDRTIPESTLLKPKSWQEAIELRRYIGDLKNNAPFAENVTNEFAEKAINTIGTIQ